MLEPSELPPLPQLPMLSKREKETLDVENGDDDDRGYLAGDDNG